MPNSRNHKFILTMIDLKTRLMNTVPLTSINSKTVADAFYKRWICLYGPPSTVHTDQGLQFLSSVFQNLCEKYKISVSVSSIYHAKGNSIIERAHRTLKDRLRSMNGHWTENLDTAVYECNRINGAFIKVYNIISVPLCDWPVKSDFLGRINSQTGLQENDYVAIR